MKIFSFQTKNRNYLLNIDNVMFIYVDEDREYVLRELFEEEYNVAKYTWIRECYSEELDFNDLSEEVEKYITDRLDAYKLRINKFEEELIELEFYESSFYEIINRREATYSLHKYSNSIASDAINLTDREIFNLFKRFLNKEKYIEEVISDIRWQEFGNCEGDEIFPVTLKATLLGSGKYMIEVQYREFYTEHEFKTDLYLYSV